MLMKYWVNTPTMAIHIATRPTWEVMNGQSTYSPEPIEVASRITLGPTTARRGSGSGRSR